MTMRTEPRSQNPAVGERKFPARLARAVGESLIELLRPYCLPGRLEIAGSLRRGRAEVGDVEICYVSQIGDVDKPGELFTASGLLADCFINELLVAKLAQRLSEDGKATWGNLNKLAVHRASGVPVDLFREPNSADWWRTLVIRTGPKDFNLKLIAGAKARGLALHAYGPSFTDLQTGQSLSALGEKEFLQLCGFDWIEPEDRK